MYITHATLVYVTIGIRANDVWLSANWTNVVLMKHVLELFSWCLLSSEGQNVFFIINALETR